MVRTPKGKKAGGKAKPPGSNALEKAEAAAEETGQQAAPEEALKAAEKNVPAPLLEVEAREPGMRTLIDRVVDFIKERKRTTVSEVAEALALERDQVEKLADILEESNLITVRYSLFHPGKTELAIRERPGAVQAKEEEKETGFDEIIERLDRDVRISEKKFLSVEDDVLTRLRRAEETLEALEAAENDAPQEKIDAAVRESEAVEKVLSEFDKKVGALDRKIDAFKRRVAVFKARSRMVKRKGVFSRIGGFFERTAHVLTRRILGKG